MGLKMVGQTALLGGSVGSYLGDVRARTPFAGDVVPSTRLSPLDKPPFVFPFCQTEDSDEWNESCEHWGPSIIDHRTLAKSGPLPLEFLRGCGLSDWQIESAKLNHPNLSNVQINDTLYRIFDLRAHQAIQVSPLFISYIHEDGNFINHLENYLNQKGIRFWRDIHHATAGRLEKQVDRAIRPLEVDVYRFFRDVTARWHSGQ